MTSYIIYQIEFSWPDCGCARSANKQELSIHMHSQSPPTPITDGKPKYVCIVTNKGDYQGYSNRLGNIHQFCFRLSINLNSVFTGLHYFRSGVAYTPPRSPAYGPELLCDEADFTSILSTIQDQYEFGHQVLADFLDGFDTYANFKEIIWDFVCTCRASKCQIFFRI